MEHVDHQGTNQLADAHQASGVKSIRHNEQVNSPDIEQGPDHHPGPVFVLISFMFLSLLRLFWKEFRSQLTPATHPSNLAAICFGGLSSL